MHDEAEVGAAITALARAIGRPARSFTAGDWRFDGTGPFFPELRDGLTGPDPSLAHGTRATRFADR